MHVLGELISLNLQDGKIYLLKSIPGGDGRNQIEIYVQVNNDDDDDDGTTSDDSTPTRMQQQTKGGEGGEGEGEGG